MGTIKHEFPCRCSVTLAIAGEIEPVIDVSAESQIQYCDNHGYEAPKEAEAVTVEITHALNCGCEIESSARVTVSEDGYVEVESPHSDIAFCEKHYGEVYIPDVVFDNLALLANNQHTMSCSRDQWCDCRTYLAETALAAAEAI